MKITEQQRNEFSVKLAAKILEYSTQSEVDVLLTTEDFMASEAMRRIHTTFHILMEHPFGTCETIIMWMLELACQCTLEIVEDEKASVAVDELERMYRREL